MGKKETPNPAAEYNGLHIKFTYNSESVLFHVFNKSWTLLPPSKQQLTKMWGWDKSLRDFPPIFL